MRRLAVPGLAFLLLCAAAPAGDVPPAPLSAMIGQMIMIGFRGTGEGPATRDFAIVLEDAAAGRIGGVVLFEPDYATKSTRNIVSIEQSRNLARLLQERAAVPLFVAVDQEGGAVRRFRPEHGVPATPSARRMGGMTGNEVGELASELGSLLARAGVNLDFAPVVDVDVNPASPAIGARERAFSADPAIVADRASAFAEGLWSRGVLPCYKHFPGHGGAAADSHLGFTDVSDTWSDRELAPYRDLFADGPPAMVMIGHLTLRRFDPDHPASLSRAVVDGMLRGGLGWDGVVITDDLQMRAIRERYSDKEALRLAVNAGVDIILAGNNLAHEPELGRRLHGILAELVAEGAVSPERIAESYRRIMRLKEQLSIVMSNKAWQISLPKTDASGIWSKP